MKFDDFQHLTAFQQEIVLLLERIAKALEKGLDEGE